MPFTIPDYATATYPDQAGPDQRDFETLAAAFNQTGVYSGCGVTAQGTPNMTVAVAAGTVTNAGTQASVASGNVTITAADASYMRFDLVCADSSGTKSAVAGTPAPTPVFPDPAGKTVLAAVCVPAVATAITSAMIVDKRVLIGGATVTKGATIVNPTGISVQNVVVWRAPYACTVTALKGWRTGGTGATVNAGKGTIGTPTVKVLSADLSLTSTDTWMDGGSVQNTAFATGDPLIVILATVTGTVTELAVQVELSRP